MSPNRLLYKQLLRPLLDPAKPPEHIARGVLVGLFWALSPTCGLQMLVVLATWHAVRTFAPRWDFNLVVALAWTWVTNVFTMPPLYYLYASTGRALLGRMDKIRGFERFDTELTAYVHPDAGMVDVLVGYTLNVIQHFGLPIVIGSIPWTLFGSYLGYRWSLALVLRIRARRAARRRPGMQNA
jgi:uncharacterized protein